MAEIITQVSLEMFRPIAQERTSVINRQLLHLMGNFFGRKRLHVHLGIKTGVALPEEEPEVVDRHVFGSIKRIFHLPYQSDPQEFYLQQQKQAIGVVGYIGRILPEIAEELDLKDEIGLLSDSPSDLFELLSKPSLDIDPTLGYEVQRHMLLSVVGGSINARTLNGRLRTVLSSVHKQFNASLFEGPDGAGSSFVSESIHDDETNQVVGFPDQAQRVPPTAHIKRIPFSVRKIPGIGLVYTSPRKKDDDNAVVKSLAKALNNGGVVDINDVEDGIGMMFVLMDNNFSPKELADRIVSVIESGSRNVDRVEDDDKVGTDHGQSPNIQFTRRKIWFKEVPTPLELMFFNRKDYLDSRLEVGSRNYETGLFEGRAHELFELRRVNDVLPVLFPAEIYGVDFSHAVVKEMRLKAEELRARYKS